MSLLPPSFTVFPYTTLSRSREADDDRPEVTRARQRERIDAARAARHARHRCRTEEYTPELQPRRDLVFRPLLAKNTGLHGLSTIFHALALSVDGNHLRLMTQ